MKVIRKLLLDIYLSMGTISYMNTLRINFELSEECNLIFEAVVFVAGSYTY